MITQTWKNLFFLPRFDVEDIRKLREHNSLRCINMTAEEIIAEIKADTADIIEQLVKNGNVTRILSP